VSIYEQDPGSDQRLGWRKCEAAAALAPVLSGEPFSRTNLIIAASLVSPAQFEQLSIVGLFLKQKL
jgi:hypothetical protein